MAKWDAARWRAVSAEIDRMLDLPADERDAALASLRTRDAALAADVAQLLAAQPAVEAGRFLEERIASSLPTATGTSEPGFGLSPSPPVLQPGTTFGGYRLGRVLGRGGMGVVYEAEELASARRVALKVLQRRHGDEYDRERFEREGRLAASIDHEHCVFVFAAAEIDGVPAIAMELMQGTLADRLATDGPLPPTAAVDAALQLVAGLQAASAAGILHRDIKPSNCFVDADGVVKIGDFGISRSIRATDETTRSTRGRIAATPSYASPEQLSGKALDLRADIYSLGTTLYELLTGERPFTGPDLMALLMAVANEPPRAPHAVAPGVPKGLSQIVLRCLAKQPDDRFQTYDALAAALEPYASWSPTPATLGRRLIAGVLDLTLLTFLLIPATVAMMMSRSMVFDRRLWIAQLTTSTILSLLYYGLSESRWGATAGKAMLGLTLVDAQSRPPRPGAAFARAAVFLAPSVLSGIASIASAPGTVELIRTSMPPWVFIQWAVYWSALALLFSTARRRNGYAGLHDLVTRTRLVTSVSRAVRHRAVAPDRQAPSPTGRPTDLRGEFVVLPGAIEGLEGWRPGYDPRLGRPIWIRDLVPGTPAVSAMRAALARPTRLRWLAGRRTATEAWDVYEAVTGMPLSRALEGTPDWMDARESLTDLAQELAAHTAADHPPLRTDRVWILASGRAKLLDDPTEDGTSGYGSDAGAFLHEVMARLRSRARSPWPVSAVSLIGESKTLPISSVVARLDSLRRARPVMTPLWRGVSIALASSFALVMLGIAMFGSALVNVWVPKYTPDELVTLDAIRVLRRDLLAERWGFALGKVQPLTERDREAIEQFLAHRHRSTLTGRLFDPERNPSADADDRAIVSRVLRRAPTAASEGDAASENPRVREIVRAAAQRRPAPLALQFVFGAHALFFVNGVAALLLAAACRGVYLRLLGFEIVTADGARASRPRVTARAAIAWGPVLPLLGYSFFVERLDDAALYALGPISLLFFVAGAAFAVARPVRGIQDRLAGTWIVPR